MRIQRAEMDWGQILNGLVGAGIGTALVEGLIAIYQQARTGRSHGKFLAFRVATELEAYAQRCLDRLYENRNYESSRGAMGGQFLSLDPFAQYPDDNEGWRNVSPQVLHLAYELKAKHDATEYGLRWVFNEIGGDEAVEQATGEFAIFGLEAVRIAKSIRQYYAFPLANDQREEALEAESRRIAKAKR